MKPTNTQKHRPLRVAIAGAMVLLVMGQSGVAAFAADPEEAATTSTTVAVVTEEDKESETTLTTGESLTSSTTTTTEAAETTTTTKAEETSTTTTTEKEPEPDFAPDYTGIAQTTYEGEKAWWRVVDGAIQPDAKGVFKNEYGWWYVKDGKVDFTYTGIAQNEYGWWRIVDGKVDFSANGIFRNEYGWWKVENGKVNFKYTGVAKNEYGWWRVKNGKVDFSATGVFSNEYGSWYVKNGKVDFTKTGTVVQGKTSYTIQKGKVTGVSLKVGLVNQNPNYPTGCEAASATMMLKYYGYDISLKQMVAAIPRENLRTVNGKRYGPSIYEKFVGDPRSTYTSANPGYGAFAPVLEKSMNKVIGAQFGKHVAVDLTGASLSDLFKEVDAGHPVMVWSTYNLQTPKTVNAWYIQTPTGPQYFSYPRGTHVCVLVGYDSKNVYLADPYGAKNKTFTRSAFNDKYKLLGKQAVVVK